MVVLRLSRNVSIAALYDAYIDCKLYYALGRLKRATKLIPITTAAPATAAV
jgi:hypothetical protein